MILPDVRSVYQAVVALVSIIDVDYVSQEEMVDRISGPNVDSSLNRLEDMLVIDSGHTEYKGVPDTKVIWLTHEYNNLESISQLAGRILPFIS